VSQCIPLGFTGKGKNMFAVPPNLMRMCWARLVARWNDLLLSLNSRPACSLSRCDPSASFCRHLASFASRLCTGIDVGKCSDGRVKTRQLPLDLSTFLFQRFRIPDKLANVVPPRVGISTDSKGTRVLGTTLEPHSRTGPIQNAAA
jgi:hypothetical protein